MIITITMNPSIDISYPLDKFQLDTVNRVTNVTKTAGGKGLNVTRVLNQTDADVLASGMVGGHLGEFIKSELDNESIKHDFYTVKGETRNCIAVLHEGKQTEILEQGPIITSYEANYFLKNFEQLVERASILSFSGSLPAGLPIDYYEKMITLCNKKNKPVVLDCSGSTLQKVLTSTIKPLLIKPNMEELGDLIDQPIKNNIENLKKVLSLPLFDGVEWVIVSMGAEGTFAKHFDTFYQVTLPKIEAINPVGSGDATIAGLTKALDEHRNDEVVLKSGNTFGMLNAQERITGNVKMENYQSLFKRIKVKEV
ncbi:hypothetical protein TEHN7128_0783 [Tetragenococcus halophilus subsp. halophilus]|uniref:tagatose-6-phosphate kinase n=1 Tax=Tetragenococcus halophilus TaxID=51669 RepID=UPI000CAF1BF3|nr:tagatose-6-phosphate kinase [Tetragenococcus halophilus]MCO8284767.1 tagatose-6-phosphate kinase [Tetragenococcus halophilus]GBD66246.1 hypothetical protein TEHN7116_1210 [Tetragenococcus halophilus subsp. halophilus]GBD77554.1 hypothetical protein TEHN7128_0783 [Tetragenococcus halophilus subsp. halophilus]